MSKASILSKRTTAIAKPGGGRNIVCLSGGLSSAWVAWWANQNIPGEVIYYFNDTKWEHPDLYRFLSDLQKVLGIGLYVDNDGRNPEEVFYDEGILGNNRVPICSRILKAERLQKFARMGDTLYFGIDGSEVHRAARIAPIYKRLGCECRFPLIDNQVMRANTIALMADLGIEIPQLYKDGFQHNNCSGGCVRAGKRQWVSLLRTYPEVYADRERLEREFSEKAGKPCLFLKDMSLEELRKAVEAQIELDFGAEDWQGECIGICGSAA